MPTFFEDAPLIELDDAATVSDAYNFVPETQPDAAPANAMTPAVAATFYDPEPAEQTGSESGIEFDDVSDVFVFASPIGDSGNGAATAENSTPAPPEEESEQEKALRELVERERNFADNRARHTATGAMLQRMLVFGD